MSNSRRTFDFPVFRNNAPTIGILLKSGIPLFAFFGRPVIRSTQNDGRAIRRRDGGLDVLRRDRRDLVAIDAASYPAMLSSFWRISSVTSFSELISGTTSSWKATFLY